MKNQYLIGFLVLMTIGIVIYESKYRKEQKEILKQN